MRRGDLDRPPRDLEKERPGDGVLPRSRCRKGRRRAARREHRLPPQGFEAEAAKVKGKDEKTRVENAKKLVLAKFPSHAAKQFLDWTMADYLKCKKPAAGKAAKPAGEATGTKK